MQKKPAAGAKVVACSVNVVWVAGRSRALHLHLEGIQKQPAAGAENFDLYTESGLGRGWVAGSPPDTNAKETRRRRRKFWVGRRVGRGWLAGGSRWTPKKAKRRQVKERSVTQKVFHTKAPNSERPEAHTRPSDGHSFDTKVPAPIRTTT